MLPMLDNGEAATGGLSALLMHTPTQHTPRHTPILSVLSAGAVRTIMEETVVDGELETARQGIDIVANHSIFSS